MSRASVAEVTSTTTVLTAADFESWTRTRKITPSRDHTNSTSTRVPSLYNQHVPQALQPKKILLGRFRYSPASAQDCYFSQLLKRPNVLDSVSGKVRDYLEARWSILLEQIEILKVRSEKEIVDAEKSVARIVYDLAAFAILDLSKDQVETTGSWTAFGTDSNNDETKAGSFLGLSSKQIVIRRDSRNDPRQAIWPLLEHLNMDFMQYLLAEECQNLHLGGPMGYLALLLLSLLTQSDVPIQLWPNADCSECSGFAESHKVKRGSLKVNVSSDSNKNDILTTSPLESYAHDFNAEVARVLRLISDERGGSKLDVDATAKATTPGDFCTQVREPILEILQSSLANDQVILNQLGGIDRLLNAVMARVNDMRNIFVQICSQLVRYNLTFGLISSYNHSCLLQRHRETAEIVLSPLQQASDTGYILQRALYFIDAYHDGLARSQIGESPVDSYRGAKSNSDQTAEPIVSSSQSGDDPKRDQDHDANEVDSEDSENPVSFATDAHGNKLRRSKRKKTQKRTNPGPLSGKPPHPPPPGGGAGSRRRKSGTGKRTTSASTTQGSSSGASSGSGVKRARRKV
ncbi:hypothetical protein EV360DRAFT_80386 [Lentinula raphanica]|nr:hypothetical protein EV360DRAFT_80386 [Lentinula raphanica]